MCSCRILQFHAFKTYFQRTEKGLIWKVSRTLILNFYSLLTSLPYEVCLKMTSKIILMCSRGLRFRGGGRSSRSRSRSKERERRDKDRDRDGR